MTHNRDSISGAPITAGLSSREMEAACSTQRHSHAWDLTETSESKAESDDVVVILVAHPNRLKLGSRVALQPGASLEIGRGPKCDLSFPEISSLSRSHARLRYVGGVISLQDLGSRNGTYVNDRPVSGEVTLSSGDRIQTGSLYFKLLQQQDVEFEYHEMATEGLSQKRGEDEGLQSSESKANPYQQYRSVRELNASQDRRKCTIYDVDSSKLLTAWSILSLRLATERLTEDRSKAAIELSLSLGPHSGVPSDVERILLIGSARKYIDKVGPFVPPVVDSHRIGNFLLLDDLPETTTSIRPFSEGLSDLHAHMKREYDALRKVFLFTRSARRWSNFLGICGLIGAYIAVLTSSGSLERLFSYVMGAAVLLGMSVVSGRASTLEKTTRDEMWSLEIRHHVRLVPVLRECVYDLLVSLGCGGELGEPARSIRSLD